CTRIPFCSDLLLEDTFKALPDEAITLSINLEYEQIISPEFRYFVRWAIANIEPMHLAIEYTPQYQPRRINKRLFRRRIREARGYGMQFGIDNVGASLANLKFVAALPAMNVSCVNKILMVRGHYHHNLTHFHFSG
ncbi:hypothetical protein WP50_03875, partial [Lactiplantibacillus plantarum]